MTSVQAVIATQRFGLGARPGELQQVQSDPRGWLKAQLQGGRTLPAEISQLPSSAQAFQDQVAALQARREAQRAAAQSATGSAGRDPSASPGMDRNAIRDHYLEQVAARYRVAMRSTESFRERLVHFWSNHFAVSVDKNVVRAIAGGLENEAIRPHLHGSFHDLLVAAEKHPAMILYLDNQASTGPNSDLARVLQRRANRERKVDINENLAREILELHTLGVSGGYTQADVTTFAKVLTGWSVGGQGQGLGQGVNALNAGKQSRGEQGEPGTFLFRTALHEPGAQTLLGKRYAQDGEAQALAVLKGLSRHPSTAKFIATKLARHFISDEPPASAIQRIERAFLDSDGDLPTVHAAVVDCDEAWQATPAKYKTPHEFVISTLRALDTIPERPAQILAPFELLGQRPYSPGSPAGWADIAGQWDGPDALMKRVEWATQVGQRLRGSRSPLTLAEQSLGSSLSNRTRMALQGAADATQGTVLWMMSPEFLRR